MTSEFLLEVPKTKLAEEYEQFATFSKDEGHWKKAVDVENLLHRMTPSQGSASLNLIEIVALHMPIQQLLLQLPHIGPYRLDLFSFARALR